MNEKQQYTLLEAHQELALEHFKVAEKLGQEI